MRLFFAIPISEPLRESLSALQTKLAQTRADVRWVDPMHYHLTIKFLGETNESFIPELSARLERVASQVPEFPIEVEGLGHFPEKGPPRVIVAHAYSPDQRLTRLHRLLDSAVGGLGLPMDTRELVPHLTLGRVSSNHGVNRLIRLIDKHETDFLGAFTADRVILFASTLNESPERRYRVIHTGTLAQEQREATGAMGVGERGENGGQKGANGGTSG